MSEQQTQQTSSEQLIGKLQGQFSAIDTILGGIGNDFANLVSTCVRLTKEIEALNQKLKDTEKKEEVKG